MEGYEFYKQIREVLPENFVDHREGNMPGAGDLYIKKTAESEELVKHYDFPSSVSTFESQTEPFGVWYEIYGGWREEYEARYQKLQIESLRAEKEMLKEKNEHLLDRLRHETITAEGSVCIEVVFGRHNSSWEINTSSILTKLIQEAGRWCESCASDLFIRWGVIQKGLENATVEPGKYVFAFRESGVDGNCEYKNYFDAYGSYGSRLLPRCVDSGYFHFRRHNYHAVDKENLIQNRRNFRRFFFGYSGIPQVYFTHCFIHGKIKPSKTNSAGSAERK